jgi:hypothetical protein
MAAVPQRNDLLMPTIAARRWYKRPTLPSWRGACNRLSFCLGYAYTGRCFMKSGLWMVLHACLHSAEEPDLPTDRVFALRIA